MSETVVRVSNRGLQKPGRWLEAQKFRLRSWSALCSENKGVD